MLISEFSPWQSEVSVMMESSQVPSTSAVLVHTVTHPFAVVSASLQNSV